MLPGDVLLTSRGTIGRCAVVPHDAELGILHPCLIRIQIDERKLLPKYLALLIECTTLFQKELKLLSNATTIDVIYSDTIRKVPIPLPSLEEQRKILSWVESQSMAIQRTVEQTISSCSLLAEYRAGLMSAAVTGQIDVRTYRPEEAAAACV